MREATATQTMQSVRCGGTASLGPMVTEVPRREGNTKGGRTHLEGTAEEEVEAGGASGAVICLFFPRFFTPGGGAFDCEDVDAAAEESLGRMTEGSEGAVEATPFDRAEEDEDKEGEGAAVGPPPTSPVTAGMLPPSPVTAVRPPRADPRAEVEVEVRLRLLEEEALEEEDGVGALLEVGSRGSAVITPGPRTDETRSHCVTLVQ